MSYSSTKFSNDYKNHFSLTSIANERKTSEGMKKRQKKITTKDVKESLRELNEMLGKQEESIDEPVNELYQDPIQNLQEKRKVIEEALGSINKHVEELKQNYKECLSPTSSKDSSFEREEVNRIYEAKASIIQQEQQYDFEINRFYEVQINSLLLKINDLNSAFEIEQQQRSEIEQILDSFQKLTNDGVFMKIIILNGNGAIKEGQYYLKISKKCYKFYGIDNLESIFEFNFEDIENLENQENSIILTLRMDYSLGIRLRPCLDEDMNNLIKIFGITSNNETQNASARNSSLGSNLEEFKQNKNFERKTEKLINPPFSLGVLNKKRSETVGKEKSQIKSVDELKKVLSNLDFDFIAENINDESISRSKPQFYDLPNHSKPIDLETFGANEMIESQDKRDSLNKIAFESKTISELEQRKKRSILKKDTQYPEYMEILKGGMSFIKYGKKGWPHKKLVFLSNDGNHLCYGNSKSSKDIKTLIIAEISNIMEGRETSIFKKYKSKKASIDSSFSIITTQRSLDLEAKNPEMKRIFVGSLRTLFAEREKKFEALISKAKNSKLNEI